MLTLYDALQTELSDRPAPFCPTGSARASDAGSCSRAIWYRVQRTPHSNPRSLTTLVAFAIGTALHTALQAALLRLYPDATFEVAWERGAVSGHADGLYADPDGRRTVVEIKTASPFAWAYMRVPKAEHILQASLSALALEATQIHLIYLNIAAKGGDDPLREFLRPPASMAGAEFLRLDAIACAINRPNRDYQGEILHPADAAYPCSRCPYLDLCVTEGA